MQINSRIARVVSAVVLTLSCCITEAALADEAIPAATLTSVSGAYAVTGGLLEMIVELKVASGCTWTKESTRQMHKHRGLLIDDALAHSVTRMQISSDDAALLRATLRSDYVVGPLEHAAQGLIDKGVCHVGPARDLIIANLQAFGVDFGA